jgi:hypothetical protein
VRDFHQILHAHIGFVEHVDDVRPGQFGLASDIFWQRTVERQAGRAGGE